MSDMNDLLSRYETVVDEINKKKAALALELQDVLKDSFKEFFDQNPKIECITWTQYTPYFNDGETCEFGVGDFWVLDKAGYHMWKEDGGGYAEEFDIDYGSYPFDISEDFTTENPDYVAPTKKDIDAAQAFTKMLSKIPDDVFEQMFDDHVEVVATRNGFDVEEYNHE